MRLIDADKLKRDMLDLPNCYNGFSDTYDKACIIGVIDEQPTIEERKTGRWRKISGNLWNGYECDQCGKTSDYKERYCPNCGARMGEPK